MNDNDKTNKSHSKNDFWATIPGVLTALTGFIVAITSLITGLSQAGLIKVGSPVPTPNPPDTPAKPSVKPKSSELATPFYDPTKPFILQIGTDDTPVSAGDEVDRVKKLALQMNLRVDQFKKGKFYITTVGFFSTREEALDFRNILIDRIPFFKSTDPLIQNMREFCPSYSAVGTHLECK